MRMFNLTKSFYCNALCLTLGLFSVLIFIPNVFYAQNGNCAPLPSSSSPSLDPEPENYVPICDDPTTIRYLPVTIHFILREELTWFTWKDVCTDGEPTLGFYSYGNFSRDHDGLGNNSYNGFQRAEDLINAANTELASNSVQRRKDPTYPLSH